MTTHVLQFVELSERERKTAQPLGKLGKGFKWRFGSGASQAKIRS